MQVPGNTIKTNMLAGKLQRGLWLAANSAIVAEIAGSAGFDWCLIDGEHGPNSLTGILPQLHALAGTQAAPVVRLPSAEVWMIKQVLDLGVQTVVVPMVDDAETARAMARGMRYPPDGIRGMGAVLARASGYNANTSYVHEANAQMCLFVQAESAAAVANIDDIAAVDGVDGVFIGPADLSADMRYPGQPNHPEVVKAIDHMIARILAAGKLVGTITTDPDAAQRYADAGMTFIGVGVDTILMQQAFSSLAAGVKAV